MSKVTEQEPHSNTTRTKCPVSHYIVLSAWSTAIVAPLGYAISKTTTWQEAAIDGMCALLAGGVIAMYVAMFCASRVPAPASDTRENI